MLVKKPYEIALIDDEPVSLMLLDKQIRKHSEFVPIGFTDPVKALDRIREQSIRAVFVDINMPNMYGDDVLRKLMQLEMGIQVYVVTAGKSLTIVDRCLNAGARDIFTKPIEAESIRKSLNDIATYFDRWNDLIKQHVKTSTAS